MPSFARIARRLIPTTAAVLATTAVLAVPAVAGVSPTATPSGSRLLAVLRTSGFAPHGWRVGAGTVRSFAAATDPCGTRHPQTLQAADAAQGTGRWVTVTINQTASAAIAAKEFDALAARTVCGDTHVERASWLLSSARLVVTRDNGVVWRETVMVLQGSALVFAEIQRDHDGAITRHDIQPLHHAIHAVVARYRALAAG